MAEEIKVQPEEIIAEQPKPRCWDKVKLHKFKILGGILGTFIFLGAVFGAYKFGQRQIQPTPQPTPTLMVTPIPTPTLEVIPILTPTPTPVVIATPTSDPTANWKTYTNEKYGLEIKYPKEWFLESDTHIFKEGDLFSTKIVGKTQKPQTEFYDGASLTIGVSIKTDKDIKTWLKDYYPAVNINGEPNEFSEETISTLTFQKVYTCGLGCFSYYNIKKGENVYRVMVFAAGPDEVKYKQTLLLMLSTFRFLD